MMFHDKPFKQMIRPQKASFGGEPLSLAGGDAVIAVQQFLESTSGQRSASGSAQVGKHRRPTRGRVCSVGDMSMFVPIGGIEECRSVRAVQPGELRGRA
jgi:hypothetical protein